MNERSFIPVIVDKEQDGSWHMTDIYSKLHKERIVFLTGEVEEHMAADLIAQILYLNSIDRKSPIWMYINSPGGYITAGLAIYDTMQLVSAPIYTVCVGMAASMGAFLLAGGDRRFALPNSEVMIHQPSGGARGQCTDILIHAAQIQKSKERLNKILSERTKQPLEKIEADVERDYFMDADEALAYGLVDKIIVKEREVV